MQQCNVWMTAHQIEYIINFHSSWQPHFSSEVWFFCITFQCFCSNFCFKASKYFESQISDSPVWTRIGERFVVVVVISDSGSYSPYWKFILHLLNLPFTKSCCGAWQGDCNIIYIGGIWLFAWVTLLIDQQ